MKIIFYSAVSLIIFLCNSVNNSKENEINSDSGASFRPYGIGIVVSDVEAAAEWYKENLNFKIYKKMEFPQYDSLRILFLKTNEFNLELIEKKTSFGIRKYVPDYNNNKAPLQGFDKIVFETKEIHKLFAGLKNRKVNIIMEITHDETFGMDFFIIQDPDENTLQFVQTKNN